MKVSVIVATYNCATVLEACLASVKAQRPPVELVVVDGGSSDGTLAILQRHGPDIHHLVSEPDQGIYDALNKGMRLASGDYICVLGSDDVLAGPDALARLAGCDSDVIYGDAMMRDGRGKLQPSPALPLSRFRTVMPISHPATLVRRSLALARPFGQSLASDYRQLFSLYLAGGRFQHVPGLVAIYALGGVSDRNAVQSTWDRMRINFELRRWRALDVVPFYVVQAAVCWLKPKLMRLAHSSMRVR
jgi:glycosyltransferase involved in cell wall biosynthesis